MTVESKLQLVILDAKPHVIDTTVVYGFNRFKSNCYWALLEEAVLYVDATDFLTRTWSSCNTPHFCNHWQPRHHHVFWWDSAGWMMSPMFLSGRPSLPRQEWSPLTLPPWCWTILLPWGDRWGKRRSLLRQILVDLCKGNPSENMSRMNEAWEITRNDT